MFGALSRAMRILQGVTGQAGQPGALAAGLRSIGLHAETCAITEHKFGYPADQQIDMSDVTSLAEASRVLQPLIDRFDIFHFHGRSFFTDWPNGAYPAALDVLLLKLQGKKVFFHYRGSEIRLASEFERLNPFHYVTDGSSPLFKKMPDETKIRLRDMLQSVCDGIFVTDPELQTYVPQSTVMPRVLDATEWEFVGVSDRAIPMIAHAPSRRGVKGTQAFLDACDALRAEGLKFEVSLIENVPHSEARKFYENADIVVDQLRIGWYGVLATEAMALGKPTVAYIRDDLWDRHGSEMPIVNANPLTVRDRLRELLQSKEERLKIGIQSRDYFEKVHSAEVVAARLAKAYETSSPPGNMESVATYMDNQNAARFVHSIANQKRSLSARALLLQDTYRSEGLLAATKLVSKFVSRRLGR